MRVGIQFQKIEKLVRVQSYPLTDLLSLGNLFKGEAQLGPCRSLTAIMTAA